MEHDFGKHIEIGGLEKMGGLEMAHRDDGAACEMRDQFISALGLDLNNPLAAIIAGIEMLSRKPPADKATEIVELMQSSSQHLSRLIDNVLDFVHIQTGGVLLPERECAPLEPVLWRTIDAVNSSCPDRRIESSFRLAYPFDGDHARIGQLFANLLSYAVSSSEADAPIRVEALHDDKEFKLIVASAGKPIQSDSLEHLLQPLNFGQTGQNNLRIRLGLHVASEIARAHGGELNIVFSSGETRFTLQIPASRQQDAC